MAQRWAKVLFPTALALIVSSAVSLPSEAQAGDEREPTPGPPGSPAKPSKERFSKAMKRLRDQRRNKAHRGKAKAKTKHGLGRARPATPKDRIDSAEPTQTKLKPGTSNGNVLTPVEPEKKPVTKRELDEAPKPKVRRAAPPLPAPQYTELEQALQKSIRLQVIDLGPDAAWEVTLSNQGSSTLNVALDPRLLAFEAHVPGKAKPVACNLPEALLPKAHRLHRRELAPGEQHSFSIDPLMYCFESGEQTILVPGTFLTPTYGFAEKTQTKWSWGRRYEVRLDQVAPFAAQYVGVDAQHAHDEASHSPDETSSEPESTEASGGEPSSGEVLSDEGGAQPPASPAPGTSANANAPRTDGGLKRIVGEGFALRSEYKGWAQTRPREHSLGEHPHEGLVLSIPNGSDAPSARDVSVTVRLENQSTSPQRVYFRRDLVSFLVKAPDGEHTCSPVSAELRAPDQQAFTTIAPGQSASFTTQLLEFCPAESFSRPGFYYISAVLPGTSPGGSPDEDAFTGQLAASKPRPVRLHRGELPFVIRRSSGGGSGGGGSAVSSGRFSRNGSDIVPPAEMIAPPVAPEPPPPPPEPPSQ